MILKAIIVPGCARSVTIEYEHSKELFELLRNIKDNHTNTKMLGVCFGGQAFSHSFGGKVEQMKIPFYRGSEPLTVKDDFFDLPFVKSLNLKKPRELCVAESHGDHIVKLPEGAKLFAYVSCEK